MRSDGTALLMLADLIRYFSVYSLPGTTTGTGQSNDILRKIISYVNEHYTEKLSLEEVANQVGFSREYFCRFFKKKMGVTFLEYQNEYRLSFIYKDLINTKDPVHVILNAMDSPIISCFDGCSRSTSGAHLRRCGRICGNNSTFSYTIQSFSTPAYWCCESATRMSTREPA